MITGTRSIRPFIGCRNFETSRSFYQDLGFQETVLDSNFSVFKNDSIAFYLQDAYVKDWVDNTMVFVEVKSVDQFWDYLIGLNLSAKYPEVKLVPGRSHDWGKECFVHDPSGVLWHFGEFF